MQKLLLFDLDGTLLTTDKRITVRSREAIRRAQDAGYIYGVCTSRAAAVANVFVEDFMPDIMIASGGAVIIDRGRSVYENSFTADQTNYVLKVCRDIAGEDTKLTIDTAFGHRSNFPFTHPVFSNWPDVYSDLSRWDDDTCLKVCVEITDEGEAAEIASKLTDYDMVRFVGEDWYKISVKDATKENAILWLCGHLGMDKKDMIAFGDDLIDIGMLKLCGTGVAMENALPEVKEAADIIIGSNDNDGIADYIEEYLLRK
ncbi:MAG: HAD family phosphatase [Oscillospiraceae bacterium]|nr:HAD family phosphatase [Oscillospiraceae bacterium]